MDLGISRALRNLLIAFGILVSVLGLIVVFSLISISLI